MVNLRKKKGVSVVIGYVILVTFGIVLSLVVYNSLKTFVPTEITNCPDGVSLFIKDYSCDSNQLNLTIKNNGRFNVNGYYIRGGEEGEEIATLDLSRGFLNLTLMGGTYVKEHKAIYFSYNYTAPFLPNSEQVANFNLTGTNYKFIELIPIRYQIEDNVQRFVSCGNIKIKESLTCS